MIVLEDDEIRGIMCASFGQSTPGTVSHQFVCAAAEMNNLGLPAPKLTVTLIAPFEPEPGQDPIELFIAKTIVVSAARLRSKGPVLFAMLQLEVNAVEASDEAAENRARQADVDGRFHELPGVVEASRLYAASSDGRRWWGIHDITGPQAGTVDGPNLVGRGERQGCDQWRYSDLVRRSVGLLW